MFADLRVLGRVIRGCVFNDLWILGEEFGGAITADSKTLCGGGVGGECLQF